MAIDKRQEYLKKAIDRSLDRYLPSESEEPKALHRAMRYSVFSGGKRIRPAVTLEAARACGRITKDALAAACAIELVHTYSLIHDDLPSMDDDDYRRGKPACHKVFGEANAILAGDALLTLAFGIIARDVPAGKCKGVIRELAEAIGAGGMVGGQALDIKASVSKTDKKTLLHINRLKTARLFEISAKAGAMAAFAASAKVKAMARYGLALGEAFQIADDVVDCQNYAETAGPERAGHEAKRLIRKAKNALRIFGRRADNLREMADKVLERGD